MLQSETTKEFWKSSIGYIIKIGSVISAITAIVIFLSNVYKKIDSANEEKVVDVIKEYYKLDSLNKCDDLIKLFNFPIDDFYDKSNFSEKDFINECIRYRGKWKFYSNNPDYSTIKIGKKSDGNFFVQYNLVYKTKKSWHEDWKKFDLKLKVEITKNYKIKSISE